MYSVYRLRANELDERFLEALKLLFVDKVIEITVNEVGGPVNGTVHGAKTEQDETAYLFQVSANRQHLFEAIEYINSGQPLVEANLDELDATAQTTEPDTSK